MGKRMNPVALPPLLCAQFLDYVLQHHAPPTTLIICSTREAFLEQLQVSIDHCQASTEDTNDIISPTDYLSLPTIHLIATSRTIHLAFTPTLPHLRAYLAMYSPENSTARVFLTSRPQKPLLAIWGLANLHRSTAEHSAQGYSRTLASAVEAARAGRQRMVLAESSRVFVQGEAGEGDAWDETWREQVPLLSGSVKFGREERGWTGRTVEIGAVVGRWCRFVGLEWRT